MLIGAISIGLVARFLLRRGLPTRKKRPWEEILPPLREVPLEPLLTRMHMEVCSSVEYPHQSGFPQTRHRRCLVTLQKPFVVCRCCCGKLPTVGCLALRMWTDI